MSLPPLSWNVHADASFDLIAPTFALRRCYPAFDHAALRPVSVDVQRHPETGGATLTYELAGGGALTLELGTDRHGLTLDSALTGQPEAPHWLHPLADGELEGAPLPRLFRTGIGFSGPTNFVDLAAQEGRWGFESYLATALVDQTEGTLVWGAFDQRNYHHQSSVSNRFYTRNFRNRSVAWDQPAVEAGFALERIPLERARQTVLPTLRFAWGQGAFDTLRAHCGRHADANEVHLHHPPAYHYCSWYWRFRYYDQPTLDQVLEGFQRTGQQVQAVQIDDGYQTNYGDWLSFRDYYWPEGIQGAFKSIQQAGYTPGIWVGPFMVGNRSQLARQHPQWLLKSLDGQPVQEWKNYRGSNPSAGHNEELHRLDSSHPDAMEYLCEVLRTFRGWGARFFKTDFLEWGWNDSTHVRRHSPGKTSAQYFDDAMKAFREAMGSDAYWLGCITYFAPSVGYMNGMRVSSDVGVDWSTQGGTGNDGVGGGTQNSVSETFYCQFFNNVLWQNDPDVLFLREFHINLTELEIETLAYFYAISGASVNTSCPIGQVAEHRRKLWEFLRPGDVPTTAAAPFFAGDDRLRVLTRRYEQTDAWAVLVMNPGVEELCERFSVQDLIGLENAHAFDWSYEGHRHFGEHHHVFARLPRHGHRLLYLNAHGTPPPDNLTLGGYLG